MIGMLWIVSHRQSPQKQITKESDGFHNLQSTDGKSVTSRYHGSKISGSKQYGGTITHSKELRVVSSFAKKNKKLIKVESIRKEHFVC